MRVLRDPDAVPLLIVSPLLALFAWWALDKGGYFPYQWLPAVVLGLCLVALAVFGDAVRRPGRAATVALAALAGYTAWSFLSMLWADAPAIALQGSQRTLLYLACFALFALLRWTPRAALWTLAGFVGVVTLAGIVTLLRAAGAEQPGELFIEHRLAAPLGYQNASAALWTMAALPALVLASSREVSAALRPILLASSVLLLGLAVLAQSRGWLFTLPLVVLATLAIVPARARLVVFCLPVAGALAVVAGDLLEPYRVGGQRPPAEVAALVAPAIDVAVRSLLGAAGAVALLGAALVFVERRVPVRRRGPARGRSLRLGRLPAIGLATAVVACATVVAFVATSGEPLDRLDRALTEFKEVDVDMVDGTRFGSLGGERYDFWRVAVNEWSHHPIGGLGQDNYAHAYVRDRSTTAEPRWVHSLPLRLLAHTGLVGAVLYLAFAVAAFVGGARPWLSRQATGTARLAGAVAMLPAGVWLVHGSVDWLWEYPALTGPAMAFAGISVALGAHAELEERALVRSATRGPMLAAATLVVVGVAVVTPAYIAERDIRQASEHWAADPAAAFDQLDQAAALNPLDPRALVTEGLIAARIGDLGRSQRALAEAGRRDAGDWYIRFARGLVDSALGDARAAAGQLRAARTLNPREGLIGEALRRVNRRRPMGLGEAQARLARRFERLRA